MDHYSDNRIRKPLQRSLRRFFLLGLVFTLSGCHSVQTSSQGKQSLDHTAFMGLWEVYNECRSGTDHTVMQNQVDRLKAAPAPPSIDHSLIPLPQFLTRFASQPGSRLAVDPKAMAASCTLQTGRVASLAADYEVARHMFRSVLIDYSEPEYAHYVAQARRALSQVRSFP